MLLAFAFKEAFHESLILWHILTSLLIFKYIGIPVLITSGHYSYSPQNRPQRRIYFMYTVLQP